MSIDSQLTGEYPNLDYGIVYHLIIMLEVKKLTVSHPPNENLLRQIVIIPS